MDSCDNIKNYVIFNDSIIKKLSNSLSNLHIEMNKVAERLQEVSDCYKQLAAVSEKTNEVT